MCGIVGYIGPKASQKVLLTGLKRLEYRGYDSAGIVTIAPDSTVTLLKTKGKVSDLSKLVDDNASSDQAGLGHTRWATHGEPSTKNAHPHMVGDIVLVHNGVIENYHDLKKLLEGKGYKFASDTDSEILAGLIDWLYKTSAKGDLLYATKEALKLVVGAYGLAIMSARHPNEMVVAKNGSPLIIGVNNNETFVASDASALVGYTKSIIHLEDGEIGKITEHGIEIEDSNSGRVERDIVKLEASLEEIQKKGFDHFLLKEIHEQPDTINATLSGRIDTKAGTVALGGPGLDQAKLAAIKHVLIVGCGSANYAGQLAAYYLEQFLSDVTTKVEIASELRYKNFNVPENTVALIVSQSGETADTIACLDELQARGIRCLGIVNVVGSTIARKCNRGVYLRVGAEISVASTKAFTSQVIAILLFGLTMAQAKGVDKTTIAKYIKELGRLPAEVTKVIKNTEAKTKTLAKRLSTYNNAIFTGRNSLFPAALEGALKLKEISYIHAEGFAAGELKHGPIALIDDNFFEVALLANDQLLDKSLTNLAEISARRGHVVAITNSARSINAENIIKVDTKLHLLAPLIFNVVNQLLAYYIALARGTNVDQPRNLAKSVTVE